MIMTFTHIMTIERTTTMKIKANVMTIIITQMIIRVMMINMNITNTIIFH